MIFNRGTATKSNPRRRTTSEGGDNPLSYTDVKSARRVTFADIHELHEKYESTGDIHKEENTPSRKSSNVGFINRNCAKHVSNVLASIDGTENNKSRGESVLDHLTFVSNSAKGNLSIQPYTENSARTFGKKGSDIGEFQDATNVTYISENRILVTDMINSRIQLCDNNGGTSVVYNGNELSEPWATCISTDNNIILTSRRRKCVVVLTLDGDVMWSFGSGFFGCPSGICVDKNGNFIVTDISTNRVSTHSNNGTFIKYIGNGEIKEQHFSKPRYVCTSSFDDILVSDSGNHAIKMFDRNGHFIRVIGKFGNGDGELKTPYGICTDSYGHILVADHYNNRISMFCRNGLFVCHVITKHHGLVHPQGVALSSDLKLFVTHGHLKASEVIVFKLKCSDPTIIVHV